MASPSGGTTVLRKKLSRMARRSRGTISLRTRTLRLGKEMRQTSFTRVHCTLKRCRANRINCRLPQEAWTPGAKEGRTTPGAPLGG
eukprot:2556504-Alexandrium_andersonii.AAC.1